MVEPPILQYRNADPAPRGRARPVAGVLLAVAVAFSPPAYFFAVVGYVRATGGPVGWDVLQMVPLLLGYLALAAAGLALACGLRKRPGLWLATAATAWLLLDAGFALWLLAEASASV